MDAKDRPLDRVQWVKYALHISKCVGKIIESTEMLQFELDNPEFSSRDLSAARTWIEGLQETVSFMQTMACSAIRAERNQIEALGTDE